MSSESGSLEALLDEDRRFAPPQAFSAGANFGDPSIYERAAADREAYWADWATRLDWFAPFLTAE